MGKCTTGCPKKSAPVAYCCRRATGALLSGHLVWCAAKLDIADWCLKWLPITHRMLGNTKNLMTLHVLDTAQWKSCAAKFLSIPAIILLFGKSQKCLYLSQISMDLNSVKKRHFASVLPQLLSTHLTSSFNIRLVQIWPRTFPLCIAIHTWVSQSFKVLISYRI